MRSQSPVFVVFLAAWLAGSEAAAGTPPAFALRAGMALEGPQHTIKAGPALGAALEWPSRFGDLGVSAEWAHDSMDDLDASVDLLFLGGLVRARPAPFGPYLEGGFGVGHVRRSADDLSGRKQSDSATGPGAWIGLGVAIPVAAAIEARLDARYQVVAAQLPGVYGGGDVEDAFSVAASFAFGTGPSRRP